MNSIRQVMNPIDTRMAALSKIEPRMPEGLASTTKKLTNIGTVFVPTDFWTNRTTEALAAARASTFLNRCPDLLEAFRLRLWKDAGLHLCSGQGPVVLPATIPRADGRCACERRARPVARPAKCPGRRRRRGQSENLGRMLIVRRATQFRKVICDRAKVRFPPIADIGTS